MEGFVREMKRQSVRMALLFIACFAAGLGLYAGIGIVTLMHTPAKTNSSITVETPKITSASTPSATPSSTAALTGSDVVNPQQNVTTTTKLTQIVHGHQQVTTVTTTTTVGSGTGTTVNAEPAVAPPVNPAPAGSGSQSKAATCKAVISTVEGNPLAKLFSVLPTALQKVGEKSADAATAAKIYKTAAALGRGDATLLAPLMVYCR
jgi:hypothetical protein